MLRKLSGMKTFPLKPLGDFVCVQVLDADKKTSGGIVLPDQAKPEHLRGVVQEVGPGARLHNGLRGGMSVEIGNTVIFPRHVGIDIEVEGEKYKLVSESHVLACER